MIALLNYPFFNIFSVTTSFSSFKIQEYSQSVLEAQKINIFSLSITLGPTTFSQKLDLASPIEAKLLPICIDPHTFTTCDVWTNISRKGVARSKSSEQPRIISLFLFKSTLWHQAQKYLTLAAAGAL